ncbi:efflux RND transporter periplasmic adaptor subunit [Pseudomonas yamanorum]|jgi:macrolide-specific efflux system membrane fusion protein|uniref:Efflux RND transporter periplasmic adaptor subunit n=1 Tax=Pseudomonas yamanorum TaxID=515393 RepID=A0A7Y8FJ62_9PSED|nr:MULTISPECIES: efflux RND transporter periplasmic adaptor subunit [Pseudomonas]MCS3419845.1 macrolide-specific efflux system membrane fusion protein [Pseudomonas sp. BIGb0558]MCS3439632.1 macrolide-specific efflux system membrane fusion protein [Pseudomonas sp. BIGb0450]NVZ84017.1 efflux RND transporter periplasmic adaptor subunit [Pseudomonas yamanorum]NWE17258.1 efflux RND transporter periplasmic adaptor subunit [Pseudomonas yamanorum]NWE37937.1 efflux RND transporter periplasmic adaptor s
MNRPRQTRRALVVALCLIPMMAVAAWQFIPPGRDKFATLEVRRGDIESSVTALGTLQPRRYVDVGAQASGQIRKIHVEAGAQVKEGDLLVEIDPSTQQAKLDASRFSVENLQAQLQEQRAQHQLARQKYQRQQRLAAGGATREEDVQTAQAELDATQARIDMFQAQIRQAQASLRSDQAELGYTRIYAPMSGTVVALDAREGQTLNAQQQTPLILRIARLSPMTVWAEVSEADIGHVKPGMTAYFTTLSGGNRRWTSTVRQILPVPPKPLNETSQGGGSPSSSSKSGSGRVVLYTVLLDVDNADNTLMAEMTAQVFFVASQASDVLTAPVAALQVGAHADRQLARVVTRDGSIQEREVRVGISDRLRVQILDGLNEGDHLLIGPADGSGG